MKWAVFKLLVLGVFSRRHTNSVIGGYIVIHVAQYLSPKHLKQLGDYLRGMAINKSGSEEKR